MVPHVFALDQNIELTTKGKVSVVTSCSISLHYILKRSKFKTIRSYSTCYGGSAESCEEAQFSVTGSINAIERIDPSHDVRYIFKYINIRESIYPCSKSRLIKPNFLRLQASDESAMLSCELIEKICLMYCI